MRNGPKWTIFASGGLGLLQMVSKPDPKRRANEDTRSPRGVDCKTSHRLEREIKHSL